MSSWFKALTQPRPDFLSDCALACWAVMRSDSQCGKRLEESGLLQTRWLVFHCAQATRHMIEGSIAARKRDAPAGARRITGRLTRAMVGFCGLVAVLHRLKAITRYSHQENMLETNSCATWSVMESKGSKNACGGTSGQETPLQSAKSAQSSKGRSFKQ